MTKKFFYIRYVDEKRHLRLRFHISEGVCLNQLIQEISKFTKSLVQMNVLSSYSFDCYEREVERYGGPELIESAEEFFYYDSLVTLKIIEEIENKTINLDKFEIVTFSVCKLMTDAGIPLQEQFKIFDSIVDKNDFRNEFKVKRNTFKALLDLNNNWGDLEMAQESVRLNQILDIRKDAIRNYWTAIENLSTVNRLTNTKQGIMLSLVHMHFNRLFGINREDENKGNAFIRHSLHDLVNYKKAKATTFAE